MKQTYSGTGVNTTTSLLTYLQANNIIYTGNLYAIGIGGFGTAYPTTTWKFFLTDLEYPVKPAWVPNPFIPGSNLGTQTFYPTRITRSSIEYTVGLESADVDVTWQTQDAQITPATAFPSGVAVTPPYVDAFNAQPSSGTVYQNFKSAFLNGQLDQAYMCIWRIFMQYPNDVNSFGMCVLFNGRISSCTVDRQQVAFKISSFLEYFQTKIPTQLIQPQNRGINYGYGQNVAIATATLQAGTTQNTLVLNQPGSPLTAGQLIEGMASITINPTGSTSAPQQTVYWRQIRTNTVQAGTPGTVTAYLYEPLPITPTAGVDQAQFYSPLSVLDSGKNATTTAVPSVAPFTITVASNPPGFVDYGVTYTSGTNAGVPFQRVYSSPNVGQYMVFNGVYTFNSGDAGVTVSIVWGTSTGATNVGPGFPYVPVPETAF